MRDDQSQLKIIIDNKVGFEKPISFDRNRIIKEINHTKRISVIEKIIMMLVLVGLAFTIYSAATMYFQNCWIVSSIPFYFGSLQFVLTFSVFIYNIKISKIQLWAYKLIGVMNILTGIINLIMYYVQFQANILCSNAICHSNFTGAFIIENIPSEAKQCSQYSDLHQLQKSNAIFLLAQDSLNKICSNTDFNQVNSEDLSQSCNLQLQELYVFNQTGYFIGLMIVTTIFILHGAMHLYKAIKIDKLKNKKGDHEQFPLQIFEDDIILY